MDMHLNTNQAIMSVRITSAILNAPVVKLEKAPDLGSGDFASSKLARGTKCFSDGNW